MRVGEIKIGLFHAQRDRELGIFHFFHLCLSMAKMTDGDHQGIVAILVRLNHTNHPRNLLNVRSWIWLFLVSFPSSFLMDLKISSLLRGKIEPAISSVGISSYLVITSTDQYANCMIWSVFLLHIDKSIRIYLYKYHSSSLQQETRILAYLNSELWCFN